MGYFIVMLFACSAAFIIGFFAGCVFYIMHQDDIIKKTVKKVLLDHSFSGDPIEIEDKKFCILEILK